MLYALVNGQNKLCEINLKTNSVTWRNSGSSYSYNFGSLYDGVLLNTGYDDFIVVGHFYNRVSDYNSYRGYTTYNDYYYWYAYSYKSDKWINLSNWEVPESYGSSLFFDPTTYRFFYHINGKEAWDTVDLTKVKIKGKELFVEGAN